MLEARSLRRLHLGPIGFALGAHECVSVSGQSGAGKSLLLPWSPISTRTTARSCSTACPAPPCPPRERQRLAVLRALRPANRVLLLDEPTSGLDPGSSGLVEALLRERLAAGTAILLVTHDAEQAARMASRHLEVRAGELWELAP